MFLIKADKPVSTIETPNKNVATVLVRNGDKILMGKRNDNGRYTNPGGHFEAGEDPQEAAARELYEEAGIKVKASELKKLASKDVTTFTGKKLRIHAFEVEVKSTKTSSKNDPDKEVDKWEWIDVSEGLPESVASNLHSPKNVVLKESGLQKSEFDFLDLFPEYFKKSTPMSVRLERLYARKGKIRPGQEGYTDQFTERVNERMNKSFDFYVMDLVKSAAGGAHKYLRKYQRGGKWIYIYHEGQQHGRRIEPAAFEAMKRLAEAGHADSKHLVENIQEHPHAKLEALRRLADSGHAPSKEHLRSLGIDRDQEKLEEKLVPRVVAEKDKMDKELNPEDRRKMIAALKKEIEASKTHLAGYQSDEIGRKVFPTLNSADLSAELERATTLREGMDALGKIAHKLETAQGTTTASRPSDYKTYGNLIYNKGLEQMKTDGLLPQEYVEEHKRTHRTGVPEHKDLKGIQERAERAAAEKAERDRREAAERAERERRELAEVHGSMAHHMSSLVDGGMSTREIKELHQAFSRILGKNMRKEDWPYDFSADGYKVKLRSSPRVSGNHISMTFSVKDRDGNEVVRQWDRSWKKDGTVFDIHNDYLAVNSSSRGGDKPLGSLINQSQIKFIKEHAPTNGQITVYAALDVGGYNWANQGFSFAGGASGMQSEFKSYLARHGITMSQEEASHFTLPCHFASFDTGKKVVRNVDRPIGLTTKQKETKTLSGKPGGTALTASEISSGKTSRIECHLGKDFLLGKSWNGIIKASHMNDSNEAFKYFQNYETMRNSAWKHFNAKTKGVIESKQNRGMTVPAGAPAISSAPATGPPAATRRVVRPRNFARMPSARQTEWFERNQANMSRASRIAARRLISDTQARERSSGSAGS